MRKIVSVLVAVVLCAILVSCGVAPENQTQLKITPVDRLTTILHAGGELEGKKLLNCQEAFYRYYDMGFRYFEYDLKLSSDGRLIGTHSWEHLSDGYDGMSYEAFCALRLEGGYTPVNEDWLVEMLRKYPDVTVIVDAKMETTLEDAAVIKRLNELQTIHGIDLSERIISEVFSVEMWQALDGQVTFKHFLFSRYKEYYDVGTVVDNFPVGKFIGVALPYDYLDDYYKRNIAYFQERGYRIFMFGINSAEDVTGTSAIGADTVYIDGEYMLPSA